MNKSMIAWLGSVAIAATCVSVTVLAQSSASVSIPVNEIKYFGAGVTDGKTGELKAGPAYGDLGKGAHGTFIRMPAGFVSSTHLHTGDYWGVVISGLASNGLPGSKDILLPVGSYWFQKGGELHVTKCLSPNECLFFIGQNSKFDYVPEKDEKQNKR